MQPPVTVHPLGPYDDLSQGKTLVEYVWIASSGCSQLRSKTRVLDHHPTCVEEVPMLVVEGSSDSASAEESELCLKPRKVFPDPFRGNGHLLVLCDSFVAQVALPSEQLCGHPLPTLRPHPSNARVPCQDVMAHAAPNMIAFAFQQEYMVLDPNNAATRAYADGATHAPGMAANPCIVGVQHHILPLGGQGAHAGSMKQLPTPASSHSNSAPVPSINTAGGEHAQKPLSLAARKLAERHLMICLRAGINISEISQRACTVDASGGGAAPWLDSRWTAADGTPPPDVWTYKLGPTLGIDTADQLWMSRFLMMRASELDGLNVIFDPHAVGDPASGMHCRTECSTEATRCPTHGLAELERHVALLHVAQLQYGPPQYTPNNPRTSCHSGGGCGLRVGVGKSASAALPLDVVIPTTTLLQGCGHWIDCRPASNADPYLIISSLAATVHQGSARVPVPVPGQQQQQQQQYLQGSPTSILVHTLGSSASHASALHSHMDDSSSSWSLGDSDSDDEMSAMNSEDVLIDELDRIDAGRCDDTSTCDSLPATQPATQQRKKKLKQQQQQQQRRRRQHSGYEEYCSSGSSPVMPVRYGQQWV